MPNCSFDLFFKWKFARCVFSQIYFYVWDVFFQALRFRVLFLQLKWELEKRTKDKTGDGQLDKDEFWRFISSIGGIAKEASCLVQYYRGH